jgi:hypothetical protein
MSSGGGNIILLAIDTKKKIQSYFFFMKRLFGTQLGPMAILPLVYGSECP